MTQAERISPCFCARYDLAGDSDSIDAGIKVILLSLLVVWTGMAQSNPVEEHDTALRVSSRATHMTRVLLSTNERLFCTALGRVKLEGR
jgi:hypothetical protein